MEHEEVLLPEMDIFKHIYTQIKDKPESEREAILARDLTEEVDIYINQKIKKKELSNISIRGEVGTGKSVLALELQRRHNAILSALYDKEISNYTWIASDQIEFLRISRTNQTDICVEIDEFSSLGNTGANATTEQAELEWFSDLCRIQGIHRVSCSPTTILDKNAFIILDVIGTRKDLKLTNVKIHFRDQLSGQFRCLGQAWLDVSTILNEPYYKTYEQKKVNRINLLKDYGVRDVREMEFIKVGIQVITLLHDRTKWGKVKQSQIRSKVSQVVRKRRQLISFIAEDEIVKPILPVLENLSDYYKCKNPDLKKELKKDIDSDLEYMHRISEGYDKYMGIE